MCSIAKNKRQSPFRRQWKWWKYMDLVVVGHYSVVREWNIIHCHLKQDSHDEEAEKCKQVPAAQHKPVQKLEICNDSIEQKNRSRTRIYHTYIHLLTKGNVKKETPSRGTIFDGHVWMKRRPQHRRLATEFFLRGPFQCFFLIFLILGLFFSGGFSYRFLSSPFSGLR